MSIYTILSNNLLIRFMSFTVAVLIVAKDDFTLQSQYLNLVVLL